MQCSRHSWVSPPSNLKESADPPAAPRWRHLRPHVGPMQLASKRAGPVSSVTSPGGHRGLRLPRPSEDRRKMGPPGGAGAPVHGALAMDSRGHCVRSTGCMSGCADLFQARAAQRWKSGNLVCRTRLGVILRAAMARGVRVFLLNCDFNRSIAFLPTPTRTPETDYHWPAPLPTP